MDRRPPLAVSPRRLRPLRVPAPCRTPPAVSASLRETQIVAFSSMAAPASKSPLRPDYEAISHELLALARRAKEQFGAGEASLGPTPSFASQLTQLRSSSSPVFERGRRYDLYSARRNDRLRRRKAEAPEGERRDRGLGAVNTEVGKKKAAARRADSVRKSVPADFSVPPRSSLSSAYSLRSSVRSSQELKKALSAFATPLKAGVAAAEKKTAATRSSFRRN